MLVRVHTHLPISAETACALALRPQTLRYVLRPLLSTNDDVPDRVEEGDEIAARLYVFGVLPAWRHRIRLVSVLPTEIHSQESGGPVRSWRHRLIFEETSAGHCRYTDEVEIDAGLLTPLVAAVAHLMYRWRSRRWRTLAAGLTARKAS